MQKQVNPLICFVKIRNLLSSDAEWTEGYINKDYVQQLALERFQHDAIEQKMLFFDQLLDFPDDVDPAFVCTPKFQLIDLPPALPAADSGPGITSIEDTTKHWLQVRATLPADR